MQSFTINFDTGGNHGHKIKDYLGGLTIGELFNLKYVHTPYKYLDFFGVGYKSNITNWRYYKSENKNIKRIKGPFWDGISNYKDACNIFLPILAKSAEDRLLIFEKAMRIHPFQTIPWYHQGLIKKSVFDRILDKVTKSFNELHLLTTNNVDKNTIKVAIHINRGIDFDKERFPKHFSCSDAVRYMFPMSYYSNIIEQVESYFGYDKVLFTIYTERLNCEEIIAAFSKRKNTKIFIGPNRSEKKYDIIHEIFMQFVKSDILVCSNSSFSSVCAYFRKGKKTIYHPHRHLNYLPEPEFIKTDTLGIFDVNLLYDGNH